MLKSKRSTNTKVIILENKPDVPNEVLDEEKAAAIAKKAYKENRPIIDVAAEETDITKAKLIRLLDPSKLSKGGI